VFLVLKLEARNLKLFENRLIIIFTVSRFMFKVLRYMRFDIITIFPQLLESYFSQTILARAKKKRLLDIRIHDLRKYAPKGDPHKSVDDRPYGGGPGMILKVEPIFKALRKITNYELRITNLKKSNPQSAIRNARIIMLTPSGKRFTQRDAERLSKYKKIILLCGRYEGFDARIDKLVDEKISIGDYVLAGGEVPAMVVVETVARHIPGVVGHKDALREETFSKNLDYKEYPQYTRPEIFYPAVTKKQTSPRLVRLGRKNKKSKKQKGGLPRRSRGEVWRVPQVLLSGNHKKIQEWREKIRNSKNNT